MKKIAKIGIVTGAVSAVGILVHTAMKKSFRCGFETGTGVAMKTADDAVGKVVQKYNSLVDTYNKLYEEYEEVSEENWDLFDEVHSTSDEDNTEE